MSVLEPLKEKIQTTDELIDQIVYKLYNLTPERLRLWRGGDEANDIISLL